MANIDGGTVDLAAQKMQEFLNEERARLEESKKLKAEAEEKEEQALAEQEDPRDSETWGAKAFIKEGQSIL